MSFLHFWGVFFLLFPFSSCDTTSLPLHFGGCTEGSRKERMTIYKRRHVMERVKRGERDRRRARPGWVWVKRCWHGWSRARVATRETCCNASFCNKQREKRKNWQRQTERQTNRRWKTEPWQPDEHTSFKKTLSLESQTDKEIGPRREVATVNTDRQGESWNTLSRYCKWKSGWGGY